MGYDLILVSLRDVVCANSIGRSLYSCIQGVFMPFAVSARAGEEPLCRSQFQLVRGRSVYSGYDLALVSLRDVVCVSPSVQFILVQTRSICAIRSFSSCGQGAYMPLTVLARAGEEPGFLYPGKMTVFILGMCIAFSVGLWCLVNLRHQTVLTIFSYVGTRKLFACESQRIIFSRRAVQIANMSNRLAILWRCMVSFDRLMCGSDKVLCSFPSYTWIC